MIPHLVNSVLKVDLEYFKLVSDCPERVAPVLGPLDSCGNSPDGVARASIGEENSRRCVALVEKFL